jgi:hypothetical protein
VADLVPIGLQHGVLRQRFRTRALLETPAPVSAPPPVSGAAARWPEIDCFLGQPFAVRFGSLVVLGSRERVARVARFAPALLAFFISGSAFCLLVGFT